MKAARLDVAKPAVVSTVAALSLGSLPAVAVEWSTVANTDTQTVLVDRDRVHAHNGDVRAWVIDGYDQTETLGGMYLPHRSKVMLYSLACDKRELGHIQWSMQSGGGQAEWADRVGICDSL